MPVGQVNGKVPKARAMGRAIAIARARAGMTQQQLAEASGVSRATVHSIESGNREPLLITLVKVADALKLDVDELEGVDFDV